jgi:transposase-like protein
MLTVETIGRIRREHFLKGKTIKKIARDLKVSRNTVRRVLRSGATSFEYEREVQPRPKLGRWTTDTSNAAKAAREQLTLIRVFEELRGRGYDGCARLGRAQAAAALVDALNARANLEGRQAPPRSLAR